MFADLSIEKLLVLALIALFVLGPERLPAAVSWTARVVRRLRSFADDTQRSLQRELGPDFEELRQPLRELREPLQQLRGLRWPGPALERYLSTPADPAPTGRATERAANPVGPVQSPAPSGLAGIEAPDPAPATSNASPAPWDPDAT